MQWRNCSPQEAVRGPTASWSKAGSNLKLMQPQLKQSWCLGTSRWPLATQSHSCAERYTCLIAFLCKFVQLLSFFRLCTSWTGDHDCVLCFVSTQITSPSESSVSADYRRPRTYLFNITQQSRQWILQWSASGKSAQAPVGSPPNFGPNARNLHAHTASSPHTESALCRVSLAIDTHEKNEAGQVLKAYLHSAVNADTFSRRHAARTPCRGQPDKVPLTSDQYAAAAQLYAVEVHLHYAPAPQLACQCSTYC